MGNSNEGWATCGGGRNGKGLSMVSERSVQEIASNLYHPQTGHGNIEGGENHTGTHMQHARVVRSSETAGKRGEKESEVEKEPVTKGDRARERESESESERDHYY